MSSLRPLLGALALTALLAARTMPDLAGELVLSAASNLTDAAAAQVASGLVVSPCAGSRP